MIPVELNGEEIENERDLDLDQSFVIRVYNADVVEKGGLGKD